MTSEFWLSVGAAAGALAVALGLGEQAGDVVRAVALLAATVIPSVWTAYRSGLKS